MTPAGRPRELRGIVQVGTTPHVLDRARGAGGKKNRPATMLTALGENKSYAGKTAVDYTDFVLGPRAITKRSSVWDSRRPAAFAGSV